MDARKGGNVDEAGSEQWGAIHTFKYSAQQLASSCGANRSGHCPAAVTSRDHAGRRMVRQMQQFQESTGQATESCRIPIKTAYNSPIHRACRQVEMREMRASNPVQEAWTVSTPALKPVLLTSDGRSVQPTAHVVADLR